jgi:hypothetical protein
LPGCSPVPAADVGVAARTDIAHQRLHRHCSRCRALKSPCAKVSCDRPVPAWQDRNATRDW